MDPLAKKILTFWFGNTDITSPIKRRDVWFRSTPEFDQILINDYTPIHERALTGDLDHLMKTPEECLALIISLDQFPRNIYRGTPRAFGADTRAREITKHALDKNFDKDIEKWPKIFMYLPYEHSELLEDHERILPLYKASADQRSITSAQGHHDTIKRFGRFPHRNAVLGRQNTPEEDIYMENPPTWGKTKAEVEEMERQKSERKPTTRK